jgi:hypothetical protein
MALRLRISVILHLVPLLLVSQWVRSYWRCDMTGIKHSVSPNGRAVSVGLGACSRGGLVSIAYGRDHEPPNDIPDPIPEQGWSTWLRTGPNNALWPLSPSLIQRGTVWESIGFGWGCGDYDKYGRTSGWMLVVPYWFLALVSGIPVFLLWRKYLRARSRRAKSLCPKCGYDLRATPTRCPECGHIPAIPAGPAPAPTALSSQHAP